MTDTNDPAGWVVLRCAGSETGSLEEFLLGHGIEAWTPREWVSKRLPRKKARRASLVNVLPSYVFVRETAPFTRLPFFGKGASVMVLRGEVVRIADGDLEGLRASDQRDRSKVRKDKIEVSPVKFSDVSLKGGAYLIVGGPMGGLGLWGYIEAAREGEAQVRVHQSDTLLWVAFDNLRRLDGA